LHLPERLGVVVRGPVPEHIPLAGLLDGIAD